MLKRIALLAAIVGAMTFTGKSQELGIRFGNAFSNNIALDAVFSAGDYQRLHADVTFGSGIGIDLLYDFIYKPIGGEEGLNYYIGVGATTFLGDPFQLGVVGELGLEYRFGGAPIVLGADWRPTFVLIENTDFYAGAFGINVRYVFGE
jgi:hypothetical protein